MIVPNEVSVHVSLSMRCPQVSEKRQRALHKYLQDLLLMPSAICDSDLLCTFLFPTTRDERDGYAQAETLTPSPALVRCGNHGLISSFISVPRSAYLPTHRSAHLCAHSHGLAWTLLLRAGAQAMERTFDVTKATGLERLSECLSSGGKLGVPMFPGTDAALRVRILLRSELFIVPRSLPITHTTVTQKIALRRQPHSRSSAISLSVKYM